MPVSLKLDRRTFLRGVGVTMGLPLLDAMQPRLSIAGDEGTPNIPSRMAFIFIPNGAVEKYWMPTGEGRDFEFSKTLAPLASFRDDLNILSHLCHEMGKPQGFAGGDHGRSSASFLTGAHPFVPNGDELPHGISVDQVAAMRLKPDCPFRSLELGVEPPIVTGSCDSNYHCGYFANISWRDFSRPMAKEVRPQFVFDRLFGSNPQERQRRLAERKSILDMVAADAKGLQQKLGKTDRRKLDEYFSGVRELERQVEFLAGSDAEPPEGFERPVETSPSSPEHIRQMYDLLALAFQINATRVSTLMLGNAQSDATYPESGTAVPHHAISHQPDQADVLQLIEQYHVEHFARFLAKLKSIPEGEGNLLDNSMIFYGSGLGNASEHSHDDLPAIVAGSAGGRIETGRHLVYPKNTPMANLFLSMLDLMGVEVNQLGDSTGRLDRFLA
ncbi:MAG: hypothetical protein CMJ46_02450 [Planctomyces sp.]|nr:hypothetical protein [Planctomyces sp.]